MYIIYIYIERGKRNKEKRERGRDELLDMHRYTETDKKWGRGVLYIWIFKEN